MDEKTNDQEWQKLQARIDGFLKQFLAGDPGTIKNSSQWVMPLRVMPSTYKKEEHPEMSP